GSHGHRGHRDQMALDHGIMPLAARQHIRQRMADQLADAQLALRRRVAGAGIAMMMSAGHDRPEIGCSRLRREHPFLAEETKSDGLVSVRTCENWNHSDPCPVSTR